MCERCNELEEERDEAMERGYSLTVLKTQEELDKLQVKHKKENQNEPR